MKIKFGTDGWRAVIAREFTVQNVQRISQGVSDFIQNSGLVKHVVIGFDCRFGGQLFAQSSKEVFKANRIKVTWFDQPTTTPAISLATKELGASIGVIITASHNPPDYNGYKLKGSYGGPLLSEHISKVESLIPAEWNEEVNGDGEEELLDFNAYYIERVSSVFDLSGVQGIAYDAMYGSGQFVLPKLLPNAKLFRCEWNPHFYGLSPEPIDRNLAELKKWLAQLEQTPEMVLVNDGDADRIGLTNGRGEVIDSHHIMLLMLHFLVNYKGQKGKVATGFSSTVKITQFCKRHGLELEVVPIGFKHICGLMLHENILLGGEESGGIAVSGHIPERDGIWNGLLLMEMIQETGKSLEDLIHEVYDLVGEFAFKRIDLRLSQIEKLTIVEKCKSGNFKKFGDLKVEKVEDLDGWKYFLNEDEWVMIRPSGTEPVLRTYAEGKNQKRVNYILDQCHQEILTND